MANPGGPSSSLAGRRVLVVEDEYFLADDLRWALGRRGAEVVGPVGSLAQAMALVAGGARVDVAVLDIDLRGEPVYGLADALRERGVPFVFATGYGADAIPSAFTGVPRWEKPYRCESLLAAVAVMIPRS